MTDDRKDPRTWDQPLGLPLRAGHRSLAIRRRDETPTPRRRGRAEQPANYIVPQRRRILVTIRAAAKARFLSLSALHRQRLDQAGFSMRRGSQRDARAGDRAHEALQRRERITFQLRDEARSRAEVGAGRLGHAA